MTPLKLALPSLGLGIATLLLLPGATSSGFTLTGQQLGFGQRDVRVFSNFSDPSSNDNSLADPMFPGATGLELSLWKGMLEWGSGPHGDGSGDPTQSELGSGYSNFDALWCGMATSVGSSDENIASAISGCSAGTVAFAEGLSNNGWRIRFCDGAFLFDDGPGDILGGTYDLQSVMTHEYGHVLGLGHSTDPGATMHASIASGTESVRSINLDDRSGIIAIYGAKSARKAIICKTEASAGMITITGSGFDDQDNSVWFTNKASTLASADPRVQVSGLASSNGGTQITLAIPAAARAGDVIIQLPGLGSAYDSISNAFPTDLAGSIGAGCALSITQITPAILAPLSPGSAQLVTLKGSGFVSVNSIVLQPGITLARSQWTIVNDATITLDLPMASGLGAQSLSLNTSTGSSSIGFTIVPSDQPLLEVGSGDALNPIRFGETIVCVVSGSVGSFQRLFYSTSPLPSLHPLIQFAMGNDFNQLIPAATLVIGSNGTAILSMPQQYMGNPLPVYVQSVDLSAGAAPQFAVSNLQSSLLLP